MTDQKLFDKLKRDGEEWHELEICPHCGYYCTGKTVFCTLPIPNPDFDTWEGLGWMWERTIEKGWWEGFLYWGYCKRFGKTRSTTTDTVTIFITKLIDPIRFKEALKEYLK